MKDYIILRQVARDGEVGEAADRMAEEVTQYLQDGYRLAGPLIYATGFEEGDEWGEFIQPMIVEIEE